MMLLSSLRWVWITPRYIDWASVKMVLAFLIFRYYRHSELNAVLHTGRIVIRMLNKTETKAAKDPSCASKIGFFEK